MTLRRLFLFGALALSPLAAFAQALTPPPATAPKADNLDLRFANGVVAVVEDKVITVDDLRREIAPRVPGLQRESRNEKEFNEKLEALQDDVIQEMVDRVLIVKDFKKDDKRHIPESIVDNAIADEQIRRFDGDRSKFLAYLRAIGMTLRDYRKKMEDDIIYDYMRGQQRKNQNVVSPARVETFYNENKDHFYQDDQVHMRMIALNRQEGETDAQLAERAGQITTRLAAGEKFEDLARTLSQDSKRAKGGDWGWQRKSDLKPEFSEPLFKLSKDQATAPILAPEAAYVLFVEERKFAGVQPLAEVRDQIERILVNQMARDSENRWLERLRRNGYVRIY
ncbi:MAG: peptidyl-prolyl cis-trans isomerase [Verrucomicrobia bacterium]|nr:peptidyl-prolyl cis-trans isomerase [Verrucomicrobiota bacterium]